MEIREAVGVVLAAMADGLFVPDPLTPSEWAGENLVVVDGPRAGSTMDFDFAPYLREPLDLLGPESNVNEIAVRKSAQTGFTQMLLAAIGHSVLQDPCEMMIVMPTRDARSDFNRHKLQPAIDSCRALARAARPEASTANAKVFAPRGALQLAIASSAAELRGKTVKKLWRDEIDQYPANLGDQGDPLLISEGRLMSFLALGTWKKADVSTPTVVGESAIEARFAAGDQRFIFVRCPGCAAPFRFEFGPHFRYDRTFPHKAFYSAPCCGAVVEAAAKNGLVREACRLKAEGVAAPEAAAASAGVAGYGWQPTAARPGAFPSYHFDTLSSPFVPWDSIAAKFLQADGHPQLEKAFTNLWLGLAYEVKGDAPDHVRLLERREEFPEGVIPALGLLVTCGVDVQHSGLWAEVVAWAPDRQSWSVFWEFLEGDTSDAHRGAWLKLAALYERRFTDVYGNARPIDAMAIDAGDGGRSAEVYSFCRGRDRAYAIKGGSGWQRLPWVGPTVIKTNPRPGAQKRGVAKLYTVGTWGLKSGLYTDLRKDGLRAGAAVDPPGYCHFGQHNDEQFFRQLTAESLVENKKGKREWIVSGQNHLLDCRVYATAMAVHAGLTRKTADQWRALAALYYRAPDAASDLFAPAVLAVERQAVLPLGDAAPPRDAEAPVNSAAAMTTALEQALVGAPVSRAGKRRGPRYRHRGLQ